MYPLGRRKIIPSKKAKRSPSLSQEGPSPPRPARVPTFLVEAQEGLQEEAVFPRYSLRHLVQGEVEQAIWMEICIVMCCESF